MKRKRAIKPLQILLVILATNGGFSDAEDLSSISGIESRAEKGDLKAALSLGMRYRDGNGVDLDYGKALKWYRLSADRGDAAGLDNVGFMYLRGWGVLRNPEIAVAFFKAGEERGDPQAGYNLGECYFCGQGVTQD